MTIDIIQLVSAILLILAILLQNQGSGIGSSMGGGEGNVYRKKRGLEKYLFVSTIILSIIFLGTALVNLFY